MEDSISIPFFSRLECQVLLLKQRSVFFSLLSQYVVVNQYVIGGMVFKWKLKNPFIADKNLFLPHENITSFLKGEEISHEEIETKEKSIH